MLSPAQAYETASQWVSYRVAGDPGACFSSFRPNDARPESEAHRDACIAWTLDCLSRAQARYVAEFSVNRALAVFGGAESDRADLIDLLGFFQATSLWSASRLKLVSSLRAVG